MVGSAIVAGNGVVLIEIPDGGLTGQVLTKISNDDFDFDWVAAGGAGGDVLALTIPGGVFTLTQSSGVSPLTIDLVGGSAGAFLYKPGFLGGQVATGDTAVAGELGLRGSTDAALGFLRFLSPVVVDVDPTVSGGAQWFDYSPAFSTGAAAFVFAGMRFAPVVTVDTAVNIWFTLQGGGTFTQEAATAFSAFNMFSGNAVVTTVNPLFNPLPPLVYQSAIVVQNDGAGAAVPAVAFHFGHQYAPQMRCTTAGDVLSVTDHTGFLCQPVWNVPAGTSVFFGTVNALICRSPGLAFFGANAGLKSLAAYNGLNFENFAVAGLTITGEIAAIRCALTDSATRFLIRNTGGARSDFGGGFLLNTGLVQVLSNVFGLSLGSPGGQVQVVWNGSALEFDPLVGDDMRISFATDIHTIVSASVSEDSAINFDYPKGAFGEAGAPGNNKYRFVANAETVTIGGGFSQFLLTQAANDTIDAALSQYFGWTINNPTPVIGTGSIVDGGALLVGGNITAGTNRYGVLILSAPVGGTLNYALRCLNGDARFDARVDIDNPIALGGGATALLGTIGGAGPTAAAQAQWLEVDIGGVAHWIPVWT